MFGTSFSKGDFYFFFAAKACYVTVIRNKNLRVQWYIAVHETIPVI